MRRIKKQAYHGGTECDAVHGALWCGWLRNNLVSMSTKRYVYSLMFFRAVALSIVTVWLGLIAVGSAGNDELDGCNAPSVVALVNQNYGDDGDGYKLFDVAIVPGLFRLNPAEVNVGQGIEKAPTILKEDRKPFKMNCSFLL